MGLGFFIGVWLVALTLLGLTFNSVREVVPASRGERIEEAKVTASAKVSALLPS